MRPRNKIKARKFAKNNQNNQIQRDSKYHTKGQEKYYCFADKDSGKWTMCTVHGFFYIKMDNDIIEIRQIVVADTSIKQYHVLPDQSLNIFVYFFINLIVY